MPKPTIRPPRAPKGEDPKVTIANLERTIYTLISRVQVLVTGYDDMKKELRSAHDEIESHKRCGDDLMNDIEVLKKKLSNADAALTRLRGWQDCAREIINADDDKL